VCEQLTRLSLAVCASSLQFAFSGVPNCNWIIENMLKGAAINYQAILTFHAVGHWLIHVVNMGGALIA